jgi:N-acetylneuraminic acid mutarotase
MGGFDGDLNVNRRVDIFDLETEKWSTGAQLPSGAALTHGGAVTDGTFIYLISGQPGSGFGAATSRSFRYHLATDTWSEWISFPTKRYGGATAYVDGKIYYFGGAKEDRTTLSKAYWSIDTKSQNPTWKYLGEMPLTGDHVGHAVIGGKIYIVGGEHGHEGLNGNPKGTYVQHDYLLQYDPATDTFTRKADMLTAASHFEASIHVINNRIVVFGGNDRIESQTNKVQLYDPRTNKWQYLSSSVPDARQGPASGIWKGRIYYTNGYSSSLGVTTAA